MALQNLLGDLALDATSQQIATLISTQNELANQIAELTETLNYLVQIQVSNQPIKSSTGGSFVDFSRSPSNQVTAPLYTSARQFHNGTIAIEAIGIPFQYSTIGADSLYSKISFT